jgi:hypothetical protein
MIRLEGDAASLTFADPSFHDERDLGSEGRDYWFECEVTLSIGTQEWALHLEMIEPYRADMLGFFEQLAKSEGSLLRWESEYAELHFEASVEEGDSALFETRIWWPPDYERREEMQFRVPTQRLPAFAEQLRGFVRLERGRRLEHFN